MTYQLPVSELPACLDCHAPIIYGLPLPDTVGADIAALVPDVMFEGFCQTHALELIRATDAFARPPAGTTPGPVAEDDPDDLLRLLRSSRIPDLLTLASA